MDAIRAKDILEERYFKKTFNDNIHIQLIYNILDIEKILAVHINNIVFSINNLRRKEDDFENDFLGYINAKNSYKTYVNPEENIKDPEIITKIKKSYNEFVELIKNPRLAYYGPAFYHVGYDKKAKKERSTRRSAEEIYHILCALSGVRQFCVHDQNSTRDWLYNVDKKLSPNILDVLDRIYDEKVAGINNDFIEKNRKNLTVLFDVFKASDIAAKKKTTKDFYSFVVLKENKNLGFSIKKLREQMNELESAMPIKEFKGEALGKLYMLYDFVIYKYYSDDEKQEKITAFVERLRRSLTDEDKENEYKKEARIVWNNIKDKVLRHILPKMNGRVIATMDSDQVLTASWIENLKLETEISCFSKLIYLITLFLDGKEINDLLTKLISKFENIHSFIDVLQKFENVKFADGFEFFENSKKIANELRVVKSIARMGTPDASAKEIMFVEAAQILGVNAEEDELKHIYTLVFGELYAEHKDDSDDELRQIFREKYGEEKYSRKKLFAHDTGLRNFIASNVIKSSRFKYLIRYSNAKKIRAIADNPLLIKYVLSRMPDTQIERYYKSCGGTQLINKAMQIDFLAEIIKKISFDNFKNVRQSRGGTPKEAADKQKKQAVISLYLTVLYLITKNLVNVNSRYTIAIHNLERDAQLLRSNAGKDKKNYGDLTKEFIKKGYLKKKASRYLEQNLSFHSDEVFREYRNYIALECYHKSRVAKRTKI